MQDVSDRVEKIDFQNEPLKTLEKNSKYITRDDWNLHLDESITSDLRKFRTYQGNSVRDLLRALRNKVKIIFNLNIQIVEFKCLEKQINTILKESPHINYGRIFVHFQKHHYHELTTEMQERLGPIPNQFLKYWIDRFPRLLSHSYHALQSCCWEPIFTNYYPKNYAFTKPNYFYEITEDFKFQKPLDLGGQKPRDNRDSPKRYNYKPTNYPHFVMERKPGLKSQNASGGIMYVNDSNPGIYNRTNKKGSYNFHRLWNNNTQNNYKGEQNDYNRYADNSRIQDMGEYRRDDSNAEFADGNEYLLRTTAENADLMPVVKIDNKIAEESFKSLAEPEMKKVDNEEKLEMLVKPEKSDKPEKTDKIDKSDKKKTSENQIQSKSDENRKQNDKTSNKKKAKAEASSSKEAPNADDDGFTKVRYRSNSKKQKNADHHNENVNWIVPGRENK